MENRRNHFEAPSQAHYSSFAAASTLDIGHGIFASLALSYWVRGFSPIPILAGTKAPGVNGRLLDGWARYCTKAADKGQLAAWAQDKTAGLAVCTGFDGLVAVDVDSAKAVAAVRAVFGGMGAPVKIGRRGCTALFRDPSGEVRSSDFRASPVIGPDGKRRQETLVQILAAGRETVLPPTVHPDTRRPYFWHRGSLEACRLGDLPVIAVSHIEALGEALRPFMSEVAQFTPTAPAQAPLRSLNGLERRRYEAMARGLLKWVTGRSRFINPDRKADTPIIIVPPPQKTPLARSRQSRPLGTEPWAAAIPPRRYCPVAESAHRLTRRHIPHSDSLAVRGRDERPSSPNSAAYLHLLSEAAR